MNTQALEPFLSSPLLPKLAVLCFCAWLLQLVRHKDTENIIGIFVGAAALCALRDIVIAVQPFPEIQVLADAFFLGLVAFGILSVYGTARLPLLALSYNLVVGLALATVSIMRLDTGLPLPAFQAALLANPLTFVAVWLAKRSDTESSARILAARTLLPFAAGSFLHVLLGIVLGPLDPLYQYLCLPCSYVLFAYAAIVFWKINEVEILEAYDYYQASVESLYNLFLSTGTALKTSFAMADILDSMNQAIVAETGADSGVIFLVDEFEDLISVKSVTGRFPPPFPLPEDLPRKQARVESYMKHVTFKVGETIFGEAAQGGKDFYIVDASSDDRIANNGDEEFLKLGSLIVVPLLVEDKAIGVLGVCKRKKGQQFSERDYDRCKLLANFGTLAVNNFLSFKEATEKGDIEREAGIAADIQKSMLPKKLPDAEGAGFGAFSITARGVCSDYYDVILPKGDRAVLALGDVAGKGVPASLVMVMIRSILQLIVNSDKDIATVLTWINRGITGKVDMDHFATLGLVSVDMASGAFAYANAGSPPLMIYRAEGARLEYLEGKSDPIGVERRNAYHALASTLGKGDILVLYTDGMVEAMNAQGRQYGRQGIGKVVAKHAGLAAKDIAAKIKADLQAFAGDSRGHDDQTVLVMKMKR